MEKKKIHLLAAGLITSFMLPFNVLAYSDKIIVGGENIGIHIDSKGVMVIGFYKVNGTTNKANLEVGDIIIKVNDIDISSIEELTNAIDEQIKDNQITLTYTRNENTNETTLKLDQVDGVYKTGLYVKDGITGIGTLTYIDPGTKIFGTLGHEIVESNSNKRVEVKTGTIFSSKVTGITKSENGLAGEKNAKFNQSEIYGTIDKNTIAGIYGSYDEEDIPEKDLYEILQKNEVKIGPAKILTVLENDTIEEFEINITKINESNSIKNIAFEITDKRLLEKTGGVVQGMSGSPIIQNGKVAGAVTHVILDNVTTGYGIFIVTMLEEGER